MKRFESRLDTAEKCVNELEKKNRSIENIKRERKGEREEH